VEFEEGGTTGEVSDSSVAILVSSRSPSGKRSHARPTGPEGSSVTPTKRRTPILLLGVFTLFLLVLGYLVVSSLVRKEIATFEPSPAESSRSPRVGATDTLTIDAREPDTWQWVDLDQGRIRVLPDTAGWDVTVRRFHMAPARAAVDLGPGVFGQVVEPPPPDSGYATTVHDGDPTNTATERWYTYGMVSHLLESKGHVYVISTSEGRHAKLEILSYYCPGLEAGCFTIRYALLGE
jgi:hypothetical protein